MKKPLLVLLTFFLLIILLVFYFKSGKIEMPEDDRLAWEISLKTASEFEKKYGLHFAGLGLSGSKNVIRKIKLPLNSYHVLTKNECRKLILNCIDDFLFDINNFEKIQPFLSDRPFTEQNIEIVVFFYKDNKFSRVFDPEIGTLSFRRKVIDFYTKDNSNSYLYKTEENETLEEARKIVQEQMKGS